jgi:hypothetical protein
MNELNSDINNKFIFVFDFDLTLTFKNDRITNNLPTNGDYIELFESEEKLNDMRETFERIKSTGGTIYINTRGLVRDITHILKNVGITVGTDNLIKDIKGSNTLEHINKPFGFIELKKYGLEEIKDTNILWAVKKVIYLNNIKDNENVQYNNILFFDDSYININVAQINGYSNSFLVGNDSGLIGLDYLLIKLKEILELLDKK